MQVQQGKEKVTQRENSFRIVFADNYERSNSMSHYQHLSIKERESILKLSAEGKGIREISRALGRNAGTISRELKRNSGKDGYWPTEADKQYRKRRKKCCRKRMLDDPKIKAFVQQKILDEQWSPEQIANRAKLENSPCQVSHPTIYRAIHAGRLEVRKLSHGERGIARKLRHRGKTRRKKGEEETRGKLRLSHPIEERPQTANDRSELGHWEADTVAGKTGSSCLITLTCRKSRLLLSLKIPRKTSAHVRDGMIRLLGELPPELVRSITPDRGKEFAKHDEISAALNNVPFFFPPPHAPWMRGTNENTNGLIREYCPKSTDLESLDPAFFTAFTSKINLRPRKCLGWRSPFEVFFNQLLHLT